MSLILPLAGATREIGVCLNRVVIRHRAMESRMKTLCSALLDCLVTPLQDRLDEGRRTAVALDKGALTVIDNHVHLVVLAHS